MSGVKKAKMFSITSLSSTDIWKTLKNCTYKNNPDLGDPNLATCKCYEYFGLIGSKLIKDYKAFTTRSAKNFNFRYVITHLVLQISSWS